MSGGRFPLQLLLAAVSRLWFDSLKKYTQLPELRGRVLGGLSFWWDLKLVAKDEAIQASRK